MSLQFVPKYVQKKLTGVQDLSAPPPAWSAQFQLPLFEIQEVNRNSTQQHRNSATGTHTCTNTHKSIGCTSRLQQRLCKGAMQKHKSSLKIDLPILVLTHCIFNNSHKQHWKSCVNIFMSILKMMFKVLMHGLKHYNQYFDMDCFFDRKVTHFLKTLKECRA